MTARTPDRRRECANPSCRRWFVTPHGGGWPAAFCAADCHKAAKPRAQLRVAVDPKPKRRPVSEASVRQRVAVMEHGCVVCAASPCHPAHLIDKSLASDMGGDPRAVIPLCPTHHREFDEGGLDVLPFLEPRFRAQLAFAVERFGLVSTLERVTNRRWTPTGEELAA